jgi:hypothetical protein
MSFCINNSVDRDAGTSIYSRNKHGRFPAMTIYYDPIADALDLEQLDIDFSISENDYIEYEHPPPWNKGLPMSEKEKSKRSITLSGRKLSKEHRQNISKGLKNAIQNGSRLMTEEHRKIISEIGKRKKSDETKRKMSEARLGFKPVQKTCPYCNKSVATNMYARWHGNNCKNK